MYWLGLARLNKKFVSLKSGAFLAAPVFVEDRAVLIAQPHGGAGKYEEPAAPAAPALPPLVPSPFRWTVYKN